eukprot:scaffold43082_cov31-Cyclotella_meneghiniana.AAC.1
MEQRSVFLLILFFLASPEKLKLSTALRPRLQLILEHYAKVNVIGCCGLLWHRAVGRVGVGRREDMNPTDLKVL